MNLHKKLLYTAGVALLLSGTSLFEADKSAKGGFIICCIFLSQVILFLAIIMISFPKFINDNFETISFVIILKEIILYEGK